MASHSALDQDEVAVEGKAAETMADIIIEKPKEPEVTWKSMPHKRQLAILTLARFSEPLVSTSLQSYMFYQLKSFNPSLPDSAISTQAGVLSSTFTGAQFVTAMIWGRWSDSEKMGRKAVIMCGLVGSMISCIGYGFSKSFWVAMVFRVMGGALNGNVGVMKTMISEIVQEKKYQSRAFMLFPMCFNIGVIIGPILGGLLADPAANYPGIFGKVGWMKEYPYAPTNLVAAFILFLASLGVFFGLRETLAPLRYKEDIGTKCCRKVLELFERRYVSSPEYTALPGNDGLDVEMSPRTSQSPQRKHRKAVPRWKRKLEFRRMFTPNLSYTLLSLTLMATHLGTFNSLWFIHLSTPVSNTAHSDRQLPFKFTGGLGLSPRDVGLAMAILGVLGICMQLFIYPSTSHKLGQVKSWRIFLCCFPISYFLAPYLAIIPSKSPPPSKKDGILVWLSLCILLFIQVTGRTFTMPAANILVNNACPHPSVLGTTHGLGQSFNSAGRTLGPSLGGALYGMGLRSGIVGAVWWGLSGLALLNCIASFWVREGDRNEIVLEGDEEAEEEFRKAEADMVRERSR